MDMRDTALTLAIRSRSWRSGEYDEAYPMGQRRLAQSGARWIRQQPVDDPNSAQDAEGNVAQTATPPGEGRDDS
jgi:hypothetical protein